MTLFAIQIDYKQFDRIFLSKSHNIIIYRIGYYAIMGGWGFWGIWVVRGVGKGFCGLVGF